MERTALTQTVQVGVESTPGTAVAANRKLQSISIAPSATIDVNTFRPMGTKYPTVTAPGKDWSAADIEGQPTFDEIIYLLSSVLTAGVVTTPSGGTNARDLTFTPSSSVEDAPKTFTIEQGSSVRAHKIAHGLVNALSIEGETGRENVSLSGEMFGQALTDGITLTASPTSVPLVPILAKQFSLYLDSTAAGLGTTKLTRVLGWNWDISDRFGPLWVYDAAQASFATFVETEPTVETSLIVEADTQGMAQLPVLRAGDVRFLRIEAIGAIIEAAITYRLRIDQAVKFTDPRPFRDEEGVYAIEYVGKAVHDATYGKAMQVVVTNTQTAL